MNYYETKQLEDRESRTFAGGIALIVMSPVFGIAASMFLLSEPALFVVTGLFVILGIISIAQTAKEKANRKKHFND